MKKIMLTFMVCTLIILMSGSVGAFNTAQTRMLDQISPYAKEEIIRMRKKYIDYSKNNKNLKNFIFPEFLLDAKHIIKNAAQNDKKYVYEILGIFFGDFKHPHIYINNRNLSCFLGVSKSAIVNIFRYLYFFKRYGIESEEEHFFEKSKLWCKRVIYYPETEKLNPIVKSLVATRFGLKIFGHDCKLNFVLMGCHMPDDIKISEIISEIAANPRYASSKLASEFELVRKLNENEEVILNPDETLGNYNIAKDEILLFREKNYEYKTKVRCREIDFSFQRGERYQEQSYFEISNRPLFEDAPSHSDSISTVDTSVGGFMHNSPLPDFFKN